MKPEIAIIMGSRSDWAVMEAAMKICDEFSVAYEATIVSAHRTPQRMFDYAQTARGRGLKVIIAGAGGAAHLPGMVAAMTTLAVIGVPIKSSNSLDGWDSLLSMVQMPSGVPVATVAVNGAKNAGLLALRMLSMENARLAQALADYAESLRAEVMQQVAALEEHP